ASFSGTVPNDPFPKAGGALVGAGTAMYVATDDFNGTARGGVADVGAYKFDPAGNPGWTLADGIKDGGASSSGSGGGAGGGSAGTGGGATAGGSGGTAGGSSGAGGGLGGSAGGMPIGDPVEAPKPCGCATDPGFMLIAASAIVFGIRRRRDRLA